MCPPKPHILSTLSTRQSLYTLAQAPPCHMRHGTAWLPDRDASRAQSSPSASPMRLQMLDTAAFLVAAGALTTGAGVAGLAAALGDGAAFLLPFLLLLLGFLTAAALGLVGVFLVGVFLATGLLGAAGFLVAGLLRTRGGGVVVGGMHRAGVMITCEALPSQGPPRRCIRAATAAMCACTAHLGVAGFLELFFVEAMSLGWCAQACAWACGQAEHASMVLVEVMPLQEVVCERPRCARRLVHGNVTAGDLPAAVREGPMRHGNAVLVVDASCGNVDCRARCCPLLPALLRTAPTRRTWWAAYLASDARSSCRCKGLQVSIYLTARRVPRGRGQGPRSCMDSRRAPAGVCVCAGPSAAKRARGKLSCLAGSIADAV